MLHARELPASISQFGVGGTLKLLVSRRKLRRLLPAWTAHLRIRECPFPVFFRHGTTDKYVIVEVLLRRQYECLRHLHEVRTIVDAGANIGTASLFLLNAYPQATVIALEPDRGNFEVLAKNLSGYGRRAVVLNQALWYRHERLSLERGTFRDGGEWSIQVKPGPSTKDDVEGVTIPELMSAYDLPSIDVLKIDIEGAERQLFRDGNPSAWLPEVRTIAIELHDPESRKEFAEATSRLLGRTSQDGEVTLWRRDI